MLDPSVLDDVPSDLFGELITQVRRRDRDCCRFCGDEVQFDKSAKRPGTVVAVHGSLSDVREWTPDDLATACNGCAAIEGGDRPAAKRPFVDVVELHRDGYIAEVNRRFFHPLGLALSADLEANDLAVIDDRVDPEGWCFEPSPGLEAKARNIRDIERRRRPARLAKLGYWVQPMGTGPALYGVMAEALQDEDGSCWWVEGHISDEAMVLAVVLEQAVNCGPEEAYEILTGRSSWLRLRECPKCGSPHPAKHPATAFEGEVQPCHHPWHTDRAEGPPTYSDQMANAAGLLGDVARVWMIADPDNEERMHPCDPTDDGAQPFTVMSL